MQLSEKRKALQKTLRSHTRMVDEKINAYFTGEECVFKKVYGRGTRMVGASRYAVEGIKAKRLRPLLFLVIYEMLGGGVRDVLDCAVGIEFLHSSTLILDDLPSMDNALYRRGKSCTHIVYGEAVALLGACELLQKGDQLIRDTGFFLKRYNEVSSELDAVWGAEGLLGGQEIDLIVKKSERLVFESALRKNRLLYFSMVCAGLLRSRQVTSLRRIATSLSMAYQAHDDLRDVSGFKKTGKDIGLDAANNKKTLLTLFGERGLKSFRDNNLSSIQKALKKFPHHDNVTFLIEYMFSK